MNYEQLGSFYTHATCWKDHACTHAAAFMRVPCVCKLSSQYTQNVCTVKLYLSGTVVVQCLLYYNRIFSE